MMQDQSGIYFKLELIKKNKNLAFNIHFNPEAENIDNQEHTISWFPTKQEQNFLLEALELLRNQEINNTIVFHKTMDHSNRTNQESPKPIINHTSNKDLNDSQENWDSIDQMIDRTLKNK